ncbi:MAG: hypothetical protein MZV63_41950 [Marinilabiliales bacterium]|nr:hypothetical protein [Marinilabiliales bacterium]
MAGYLLKNTLSEHGHVSRGVCTVNKNMEMTDIIERTKIGWKYDLIVADDNGKELVLTGNEYVSMNFWGLHPMYFQLSSRSFSSSLKPIWKI